MGLGDASAKLPDKTEAHPRKPIPRRTPPAESKSLPAHKKHELAQQGVETAQAQDPSKQKAAQLVQQDTHDSNGSDESASKWFDKANERGPQGQRESPSTTEPPFFLCNQKQYFPNHFVSSGSDDDLFGVEHRADSENEDLRGVIDDLTVENKRLKLLLRSTRSRPSPSESESRAQDRLFDLRVHGLNADKKRELESLLRNFATSVRAGSKSASASTATHGSAQQRTESDGSGTVSQQSRGKAGQLPTDSGYGSHSTPSLINNNNVASYAPTSGPFAAKKSRAKNIHNYLHDIPNTLLPRHSPYMSKRAKMAMVVRRLENLFTGRIAAPGDHDQPNQQQEVSHSAARADNPSHRFGWSEGSREAHMLPQDTKVNLDAYDRQNPSPPPKKAKHSHDASDRLTVDSLSAATSRLNSPMEEQRPTRPLDLDIHRAQVAAENIQYLRHLGMASPQTQGIIWPSPWIYLNLLISMAQLHTINVTPSFIRHAIRKLSTNFELSLDGHKVRWAGGTEGTVFSKEEERAMELGDPSPAASNEEGGQSSKRSKTNSSSNALISEEPSSEDKTSGLHTSDASKQKISTVATSHLRPEASNATKASTPLDYKPLVYKGKRYSPAVSYLESSESPYISNDSIGLAHALSKSNLNQKQQRSSDDGMITFYRNPFFCTDLSADNAPVNWVPQRKALPWDTLGLPREFIEESALRHHDACYFATQFAPKPYSGSDGEPLLRMKLQPLRSAGEDETVPMELPVCGIGGVVPEDNFVLDVKVARTRTSGSGNKNATRVPFTGSRKRKRYDYEVDDCDRFELRPSKLPPPGYVFATSTSPSDADITEDYSETSSEAALDPPPPAFLHQWSTESDDFFMEDDDDTSSVDMLLTARAVDPDRVAAQEREYLMNQNIGRRIEGSLAATVGASRTNSSRVYDTDRSEVHDARSVSSMDVGGDSSSDDEEE